jgi:hypothetical protein
MREMGLLVSDTPAHPWGLHFFVWEKKLLLGRERWTTVYVVDWNFKGGIMCIMDGSDG